jgi:hypothetical protein
LPVAVGLKVTLMMHEDCAASPAPHVLLCAKAPLADMALNHIVAPPPLVTFKFFARLVVPTL